MQISQIIQHAIVFNGQNSVSQTMNSDSLHEQVRRLFILLEQRQVRYVLVGGIALLQYVEGRNTEDIDLIVAVSALDKLPELEIRAQDMNFAQGRLGELKVDLLFTRNRLFEFVSRHYVTTKSFVEQTIPCATVEGLLLLKLYALPSLYRQGNFARVGLYENDIATLIYSYQPDLPRLRQILRPYLSQSDLTALDEILDEISNRIQRFQTRI